MKFDSEQVLCHSTLAHKPDSRPFEYHDNTLDSTGLKLGNGIMKENQNGVLSDLKGNEGNAGQLPYERNDGNGWNESKLDCPRSVDYSTNDSESFENDSVFYLDKSVMECGLPELIVCYKETTYHVVKDICIDEGVPSQDKFLFESGVDEKSVCTFLPPDKDKKSELMEEKPNIDMSFPDVLKSSAENYSDKDTDNQCDTTDFILAGEVRDDATEKIVKDVTKEKISLADMLSMEKLHTENSHSKSFIDGNDAEQTFVQSSSEIAIKSSPALASASEESDNGSKQTEESKNDSEELARPALVSVAKESDSGSDETIMVSPAVVSSSEESTESSLVNDLSYNSKVETGSITFNFDSCAPTASGREEGPQSTDSEHLENQSSSRHEDDNSQLVTSQAQHSHGESSFSMAGPISGLISYSGPIAYSGSVSLRSDSSTTSTRSFAFPVLQSEWNSSPVRMAKADRRHYWKHRGWRQGLLCCRF